MNPQDSIKMTGALQIVVRDESGNIKDRREVRNLVVTAGKNWIASRMKTTGQPGEMTHMAVGTSSTAAAVGDTALGAEVAASRTALVTAGGTVSGNVVTYSCNFGAGVGTGALTEAGIFSAASAGTMLCRTVFGVVTKTANDSMTITWTVTVN